MSDTAVTKNEQESRYEARVDGQLAGFVQFRVRGEAIELPHTQVDPAFGGQGIGGTLARHALDDIRRAGRTVIPTCPFVSGWIDKHPGYRDLVADQG